MLTHRSQAFSPLWGVGQSFPRHLSYIYLLLVVVGCVHSVILPLLLVSRSSSSHLSSSSQDILKFSQRAGVDCTELEVSPFKTNPSNLSTEHSLVRVQKSYERNTLSDVATEHEVSQY